MLVYLLRILPVKESTHFRKKRPIPLYPKPSIFCGFFFPLLPDSKATAAFNPTKDALKKSKTSKVKNPNLSGVLPPLDDFKGQEEGQMGMQQQQ